MAGELLAHFLDELRLVNRLGADNHPLHPGIQIGLDDFRAANTAANLNRQIRVRLGNRFDDITIHRLTGKGTVQVHQVQTTGAALHPVAGHSHRIIGKHRIVFHASLLQAYTFTVFQINGGNQKHS